MEAVSEWCAGMIGRWGSTVRSSHLGRVGSETTCKVRDFQLVRVTEYHVRIYHAQRHRLRNRECSGCLSRRCAVSYSSSVMIWLTGRVTDEETPRHAAAHPKPHMLLQLTTGSSLPRLRY